MFRNEGRVRLELSEAEWSQMLGVFTFAIGAAIDTKKRATMLRTVVLLNQLVAGDDRIRQLDPCWATDHTHAQLLEWIGEVAAVGSPALRAGA